MARHLFGFELGPEQELLIGVARINADADRIRALAGRVNWIELLRLSQLNAMSTLLYRQLEDCAPDATPELGLKEHFNANLLRNLAATAELFAVLDIFKQAGVAALTFKGPALTAALYKNLALREFNDVDLLLHHADLLKAKQILIDRGYRHQFDLTPEQERFYLSSRSEQTFLNDATSSAVDLHWGIVPGQYSFAIDPQQLWESPAAVAIGDRELPTLSANNLLLVLILHGAKHGWGRLSWICDLAEFIRQNKQLDWELLSKRAGQLGIARMVHVALLLVERLLRVEIPPEILKPAENDAEANRLCAKMFRAMLNARHTESELNSSDRFYPLTMERRSDVHLYYFETLALPTPIEWTFWPLPEKLWPLYHVIRPVRLLAKYARGAR